MVEESDAGFSSGDQGVDRIGQSDLGAHESVGSAVTPIIHRVNPSVAPTNPLVGFWG